MMKGQREYFLATVLVLCAAVPFAAQAQLLLQANEDKGSADQLAKAKSCYDNSSYESFMSRYRDLPLGNVHGDAEPVELIVSSMEGDDRQVNAKAPSWPRCSGISWDGIEVTPAGNAYWYFHGESNGVSLPIKLPEDYFNEIQKFLARLPDDGNRLPPPGHRVIVRAALGGTINTRLYDRAELPDEIIELIRLTDSRIKIFTPILKPIRHWKADELQQSAGSSAVLNASDLDPGSMSGSDRLVAENSDGSLLAVSSIFYRGSILRIYNTAADQPVFELLFPPDGRRVIRSTYIGFSPDKRHFLLETNKPEIREYDTKTWKQVRDTTQMPPGATRYVPSPDWKKGLALFADGKTGLWDASLHRMIAELDTNAQLQSADFSPQGDLLAVTSGPGEFYPMHLTIWEGYNGHLLRELWPVRWGSTVSGTFQEGPLWWDSGRLLVAPIRGYIGSDNGIGVWDVRTGRLEGTLAGCSAVGLTVEGERLFQNCGSDGVMEWRIDAVRKDFLSYPGQLAH